MDKLIELREWMEQQCRIGNKLSCADLLNKIDEILEYDEDTESSQIKHYKKRWTIQRQEVSL